jgi:hypothetical protein
MAAKYQKYCKNCKNIDRDSYRGAKVAVCYRIEDGKAVTVTDKRVACGYYKDVK